MTPLLRLEEPPRATPAGFALFALGFRPFYLLAAGFAALSVPLWALQFSGLLGHTYLAGPMWHAHEMLFGFALAVIVGFLFTAGRNWTGRPTPTGRTFVLGQITDEKQPFSPVILPLGSHSDTLDSYGGGPGTVALHGWTDPSVFGKSVSHGCVRVPDDALALLRTVPTGTPVMVDEA